MSEEKRVPATEQRKYAPPAGEQGVQKWPKAIETPNKAVPGPVPEIPRLQPKKSPTPAPVKRDVPEILSEREEERRFQPIRQRRDARIGCLGGIMYTAFILAVSATLAIFAWMSASDVLALNKADSPVEVTLPDTAFVDKEVEVKDENGNVTGTKVVRAADIDQVATILRDYGLINYPWLFKFYSGFSHADEKVDPGTYQLNTNLDYRAIVTKMQYGYGTALQTLVTLPEGFNMDQIFARLEENGVCSAKDLYEAAALAEYSYDFLAGMERGDPSRLEGFLYPDTYYFYQGMQASSAINKFLSNAYYKITDDMKERADAMGMSMREIFTVASLVEKEAANDDERAKIASVIYNRLNSDMPLQFDSTVVYALREQGITELTTDLILNTDSNYNTYLHHGLPPTPICNPGMASVQAALYPENTNYYYFALDEATNSMRFFVYEQEHQNFVATQSYGG